MTTKPIPERFKPGEIESKWQKKWEEERVYSPRDMKSAPNPYYNLMMFPYPSAEGLHVGNMYAFTGVDVHGRYKRMQGHTVFEPMGLDGFGIHSENYAIKVGKHPKEQAKVSEANFYRQLRATGNGFDWNRTVETYDPDYYRWTQWLFVQMFKHGLAYRAKAAVNYCPSCKTVLADEQVVTSSKFKVQSSKTEVTVNVCERCSTEVEKRELEQWFFKITEYAERLLQNTYKPQFKWPEKVKIGQRNWIGKKAGVIIHHPVKDLSIHIDTFSAYPGWLFADTFIVMAPEHPLVKELVKGTEQEGEVAKFVEEVKKMTPQDRIAEGQEKKGVFTGRFAVDPFGNGEMPIWIANFALLEFGTGIIRCSAHDPRDYQFASKYNIPLKEVVERTDPEMPVNAHENKGVLKDSGPFSGKKVEDNIEAIVDWIDEKGIGKRHTTFKIRDWLISRQRYWGAPIPMIHCKACEAKGLSWFNQEENYPDSLNQNAKIKNQNENLKFKIENSAHWAVGWYPVLEEELPVELPDVDDWRPTGTGRGPLAGHPEFYETECPHCGGKATRETDVCDTFLDSSWYYLRYPSVNANPKSQIPNPRQISNLSDQTQNKLEIGNWKLEISWDTEVTRQWLPVDSYIGGAEHTVLHLLYTRFVWMALRDWGLLKLRTQNSPARHPAQGGRASAGGELRTDNPEFDPSEPFKRFYAHGLIIKDGAKMSKSKGNVVVPDEYIKLYGADSLRTYLMFLGPFDQGGDFRDSGMQGMYKWLSRVWRLSQVQSSPARQMLLHQASAGGKFKVQSDIEGLKRLHKTIKGVTDDMEGLRYNTAIAKMMEFTNWWMENTDKVDTTMVIDFLKLLAPFAPHITEELYQTLRNFQFPISNFQINSNDQNSKFQSIHIQLWPEYDPKLVVEDTVTVVIQVNGKVRDSLILSVQDANSEEYVKQIAKESAKVQKWLQNKEIRKIIFVPGKLINFVI